jgi:hypothetical protein
MIQFFLAQPQYGGALEPEREGPALFRLRLNKEARATLAHKLRSWQPPDRSLTAFRRWLDAAEPHLLVTFDQATAVEHRDLPFITPVHPLARLATEALKHPQQPLAARLRVNSKEVPAGHYVFACDLWEIVAIRPEVHLVTLAWSLASQREAPELAQRLLLLLNRTATAASPAADPPGIELALAGLDERIHREHDAALSALAVQNTRLVELKLASLDAYHRNRVARIQAELANAREERIRRMKTAELARAERDHAARRSEIEHRRQADIIRERVAFGLLEVLHGD